MLVTIVADASLDHRHKVGGFGFWIVSQRGRYAGGGAFKQAVRTSQAAEMMAIVNALHTAIARSIASPGDQVLVQTDCLTAMAHFKRQTRRDPNGDLRPVILAYEDFVAKNHITVEFRHVKGHTNQDSHTDPRFKAQRHADQRARHAMRKARADKKLKESQCPS